MKLFLIILMVTIFTNKQAVALDEDDMPAPDGRRVVRVLNSYEVGTVRVADVDGIQRHVDYILINGQITTISPRDAHGFDLNVYVPIENIQAAIANQD